MPSGDYNIVSIPNGTIKSGNCASEHVFVSQVSIPNGTIKRQVRDLARDYET